MKSHMPTSYMINISCAACEVIQKDIVNQLLIYAFCKEIQETRLTLCDTLPFGSSLEPTNRLSEFHLI